MTENKFKTHKDICSKCMDIKDMSIWNKQEFMCGAEICPYELEHALLNNSEKQNETE